MQTKNDVVNIIKILPFFSEFGSGDIGELSSFMSLRQVPAETELFRAGDVGDFLFFLIEGEVEVVVEKHDGSREVIAKLGPGASVGEMAMIDEYERSATVRAATDLEILILTKSRFDSIIEEHPHIGVRVLRGLAKNISLRLRTSQGRLRNII
jgi:CRP-like cAMP-binding protein